MLVQIMIVSEAVSVGCVAILHSDSYINIALGSLGFYDQIIKE
jgi:hypothetical protein